MPVPRPPARVIAVTMLTTGALLLVIVGFTALLDEPLLVPPFATSAAILSCLPDSPVAQPRAIVGGHLIGALSAYLLLFLDLGLVVSLTLAVTLAVGAMLAAGMLHPPGAATAAIVVLAVPDFLTFLGVLALASALITVVGVISAHASRTVRYPLYWW